MVIECLYIVVDAAGLARLRPGDVALALGAAARLPKPPGVVVYLDEADGASTPGAISLDASKIIDLFFQAKRLVHC